MNYLRLSILPLLAFATSLSASVTLINDTFDTAALANGYTTRSTTDWTKDWTSAWDRTGGALVNTSTVNSTVSKGAVGYVIAVPKGSLSSENKLTINFDYTRGSENETLYMHVWGLVDGSSTDSTNIMNTGASSGAAWESSGGAFTPYNLGAVDGYFDNGKPSDAAIALTGSAGAKSFCGDLILSDFTTAPNTVAGYDYIAIGFTRDGTENTGASVSIDNLVITAEDYVPGPRPAQPNFLFILVDDLGWQDVKCYDTVAPFSVFETNNIDQLASDGVRFTNAYSPAPSCAPSRSAILSGKYPGRTDVLHVSGGHAPRAWSVNERSVTPLFRSSLKDEEISLAEALADVGYFTGVFGKWHLSPDGHHYSFPYPTDQGFDVAYNGRGVQNGMDRLVDFATSDPSDTYQLDANGMAKDEVTESALDFMVDAVNSCEPFFCYYSTWLVHGPWQVRTESLLQKYAALMGYTYPLDGSEVFAEGQNNPYLAAMVESLDYYMSRLVDYLENTDDPRWPGHKLIENTYIVFTSDNGGMEHGDVQGFVTDNFPLDHGKISIKEGGTRVPFIVSGPGISTNTVSDVVINGIDIYPTFLGLAGEAIPDRLDGCDLSNLLLNDPVDETRVVHHQTSQVRDTMFWHFPFGWRVATTVLKDGWKLYKNYDYLWNDKTTQQYSLYQLYDSFGAAVDEGEMTDLIAGQPVIAADLAAEIEAWISEVDARSAYYNPLRTDTPFSDQSPKILASGNDDYMAWLMWNTNKAEVKHIDLLYTKNATGTSMEEWFRIPVPFEHADGWAEVQIPEGAEAFMFNLIDENNFFVSSNDLTGKSGRGSEHGALRTWLPENEATISDIGAVYPTNDVLLGNSVGEALHSSVRDDYGNYQVLGQTFTITEPVRISALTLQSNNNFAVGGTDAAELYLWIGEYSGAAPTTNAFRTRVFDKVNMRNLSTTAGNYYTIDFTDAVLTPGTYAFQFRWKEQASGNVSYWTRANGAGDYAGGDRIHIQTTAGSVLDLPFSATPDTDWDLVFALHGTVDYFGEWTVEQGIDRAPDVDPYANSYSSGSVQKNSVFFTKASSSAWRVEDGVLINDSNENNYIGEGAFAKVIDLTGLEESDRAQLALSFDYSTAETDETLFVHLWGYKQINPGSNPNLINTGAADGNAWLPGSAGMDPYNLSNPEGVFNGTAGQASDCAAILAGTTGPQSYSDTFDVSANTTAPNAISDYDYIVLAFGRNVGGAAPASTISNIQLSVVGGATLLPEASSVTEDGEQDDPDGDKLANILEYGLGGDPNARDAVGLLPTVDSPSGTIECSFRRRRDAGARGLSYQVKTTGDLVSPSWAPANIITTNTSIIDSDFEMVTHGLNTTGKTQEFIHLEIE